MARRAHELTTDACQCDEEHKQERQGAGRYHACSLCCEACYRATTADRMRDFSCCGGGISSVVDGGVLHAPDCKG